MLRDALYQRKIRKSASNSYLWGTLFSGYRSVRRPNGASIIALNENFIAESLIYELDEKIGFKSTSCPPQHKRKDLFKAILKSAIPIALWTRYNWPNRHQEIEKLLNWQPLNCLCDSIKKKRMNDHRKEMSERCDPNVFVTKSYVPKASKVQFVTKCHSFK